MSNKRKNKINNIKKTLPFSEANIIRQYYNYETNSIFNYSDNMLTTRVNRDTKKIQKSFDKINPDRIKFLDKFYSMTVSYIDFSKNSIKDEKLLNYYSLLLNAANTITASFETLRNGYIMQSPVLLRSVSETFCLISVISSDDESYNKFLNDKLDINSTIKPAKKLIPQIGVFQGLLSNNFVHLNSLYLKVFNFLKFDGFEDAVSILLDLIANSIMLLYLISELILSPYNDEEILFWKFNDKHEAVFNVSPKGKEILDEYQKYFSYE